MKQKEIKPKKLLSLNLNVLKFSAGIEFAKNNNMEYCIVTEDELEDLNKWIENI
jgi:hypothetical protein